MRSWPEEQIDVIFVKGGGLSGSPSGFTLPDALLFSGKEDASLSVWNICSTKPNGIHTYIQNIIIRYIYI